MRKKIIVLCSIVVGLMIISFYLYNKFAIGGEIVKIYANPEKGFNYGYYLFIPEGTKASQIKYMFVEPNNTGRVSDDQNLHENDAKKLIIQGICNKIARKLRVPLVVPFFDRPASYPDMYTHALDRDTLINNSGKLARIDLQLIEIIKDAKQKLKDKGIIVEDKVFMHGFSASGSFTNRFTVLHPDMVKAVASGGLNYMPILPTSNWEGEKLIYPVGVSDVEEVAGIKFNIDEYKKVPQYIYMGYMDDNDTLPYSDAFGNEEKDIIKRVLGIRMKDRWEKSKSIYGKLNIPAQLVMYNDVGHQVKDEIINDIIKFFKANTTEKIINIEPYQYAFQEFRELEQVHVKAAYWNGDKNVRKFISLNDHQFIILTEDWIKNRNDRQLGEFIFRLSSESKEFILKAEGKQDIKCFINGGSFCEGDGTYQGYIVEVSNQELEKMEAGIPYTISINNKSDKYFWVLNKGITITRTR